MDVQGTGASGVIPMSRPFRLLCEIRGKVLNGVDESRSKMLFGFDENHFKVVTVKLE